MFYPGPGGISHRSIFAQYMQDLCPEPFGRINAPLVHGEVDAAPGAGGVVDLLGLGDHRANSVKRYLESLGADTKRLETLSKGSTEAKQAGEIDVTPGDFVKAAASFRKAIELDPGDHELKAGIAAAWMDLGDMQQAELWLQEAAKLAPDQPSTVSARIQLLLQNEQAQQALALDEVSYIPAESAALRALAQVNQDVVRELGRRCADQKIATVDLDSTIIESWKKEAKRTYEGPTGYQPMLALWAEMNVVLADEFRDGNVPAQQQPLRVARRAFADESCEAFG